MDINGEYHSTYTELSDSFTSFYFHGTYLTLQEFDEENGFNFPDPSKANPKFDDLILLMEYFYNMLTGYMGANHFAFDNRINTQFLMQHILKVSEAIGYTQASEDGFTVFVEKNAVVSAVAESELIPLELSYKLIAYDHHSMRGDLEGKKTIILRLAALLEAKKSILHQVNLNLENDLFYIFNNFNLRHNNCDSSAKGKYKPYIANMKEDDLEKWYDEAYQMCLLAFMEIEQAARKPKFDAIKTEIEKK